MSSPSIFNLREFFMDLSYEETHAFQIGFTIAFLAAFTNASVILSAFISILLWALGIRGFPSRDTATGDPKGPSPNAEYEGMYRELESKTKPREYSHHGGVPDFESPHIELMRQIRREPHYYIGGGIIGDRLGASLHFLLYEEWPTIYSDLPGIVEILLLV